MVVWLGWIGPKPCQFCLQAHSTDFIEFHRGLPKSKYLYNFKICWEMFFTIWCSRFGTRRFQVVLTKNSHKINRVTRHVFNKFQYCCHFNRTKGRLNGNQKIYPYKTVLHQKHLCLFIVTDLRNITIYDNIIQLFTVNTIWNIGETGDINRCLRRDSNSGPSTFMARELTL